METRKSANIGARLDRLPNSGWHIKMWLVTAFALLVCWSNGIGGSVQNILLNELHWLEPGTKLLAMWGTTYTAGQLFGALVGGPIGDKIGRKKSILLYEIIHIIAMIGRRDRTEHLCIVCIQTCTGIRTRSASRSSVCRIYRVCAGKKPWCMVKP